MGSIAACQSPLTAGCCDHVADQPRHAIDIERPLEQALDRCPDLFVLRLALNPTNVSPGTFADGAPHLGEPARAWYGRAAAHPNRMSAIPGKASGSGARFT